jgi:hypothetical protein
MGKIRILFALAAVITCACAFQKLQTVLDESPSGQAPRLPIAVTRLSVADARPAVDYRDMKISAFAIPGRRDESAPSLSGEQKDVLEKEFSRYLAHNSGDYTAACTILVLEGVMQYTSAWSGEDMVVKSKLRVVLIDSLHTPFLASAIGEAELSFKSNIANKKNFEKLYQKAMKMALFKAMESIGPVVNSIVPENKN